MYSRAPKIITKRHLRRRVNASVRNSLHELLLTEDEDTFSKTSDSITHIEPSATKNRTNQIEAHSAFNNLNATQNKETLTETNYVVLDDIQSAVEETFLLKKNKIFDCKVNVTGSETVTDNKKYNSDLSRKEEERIFLEKFKNWACTHNITHSSLSQLITLIKPKYPFLAVDPRTILGTPRTVMTTKLDNGEMFYFGVKTELERKLRTIKLSENIVSIQFNIDGFSPFKNSYIEFWPILGKIDNIEGQKPFVVAVFGGRGKPLPVETYLGNFVNEMNDLLATGIKFNDKQLNMVISLFSCDAPARAFLKQIKGHTSKNGCERCTQQTVYENKRHFYPVGMAAQNRHDADFSRDNEENNHIKGFSPLLSLHIGLVTQFVLDPMHLVYLGVTKRLLQNYWVEGKKNHRIINIKHLDKKIKNIKFTDDFGRKLGMLSDVKRWKAVEYRNFLLYCSPFLLKDHLEVDKHKHFLNLHVAIFILTSKFLSEKYLHIAKNALNNFVNESPRIYDKYFVVYNVHSLIHLCDDVEKFGQLESFSCFEYENLLGKLKKSVRGTNRPLQQLYNRIEESRSCTKLHKNKEYLAKGKFLCSDNNFRCSDLFMTEYHISVRYPNNIVMVGNKFFIIKSLYFLNNNYLFSGSPFRYMQNLYKYPIESSKLYIYFVRAEDKERTVNFLISSIRCKCMAHKHKDGYAVFPILHTLNN